MDRDPGILTCCYFRTQASGFSQPSFLLPVLILCSPRIQASWFQSLPLVLTAELPVLGSGSLGPLHSRFESQTLKLGFQQPQLSLPGCQQIPGNLAQLCLLILA